MSIVFVSPGGTTGGGGMGTVTRSIVTELERRGDGGPVIVLDPRGEGSVLLFPFYLLAAFARMFAAHWRHGIDVLHLNVSERLSFPRKTLFLIYGRLFGIPVVLHHHGAELIPEYEQRSAMYRALVRWAVCRADCNIVLGRSWADFLRGLGVPEENIVLMYNAVADPGRPATDAAPADRAGPTRLLILANLSPRKGVGELLQAVRELNDAGTPVELTLAGGGEVKAFRDMADGLGIGEKCRFTGWIPAAEAARLWAGTDIFVLPSHHEGLPMSILEALSYSVPVVATPVGSIPEVLTSGENCLLVTPGDVSALRAAIAGLIADLDGRAAMAGKGRALYEQRFALDRYVDRLLDIYARLQPPQWQRKRA